MNDVTTNQEASEPKRSNSGRWTIIALAAVFILPWVFAFLWTPSGRVNNGELIEPVVTLPEFVVQDADQKQVSFSSVQPRWVMLTTADTHCDEACEKTLYAMRQVRLSLGKHGHRVRSVLLTRQPLSGEDVGRYQVADPNLVIFSTDQSALDATDVLFNAQIKQASAADGILLIDPRGNLMMRYSAGFEPKLIRKDLSRLLKASRIG